MSQSARILIVDDTTSSRILLGDLLELKGYTVLSAASGPEALKVLESEQPDLILLDVLMPEMDGYQVCRKIRENPAMQILPIILMTGLDPFEERAKGREAGANDIIVKPIHLADLLESLKLLGISRDARSNGALELDRLAHHPPAAAPGLSRTLPAALRYRAPLAGPGKPIPGFPVRRFASHPRAPHAPC